MKLNIPQGFPTRPKTADPSKGKIFQDPLIKLPPSILPPGKGNKQGPSTVTPSKKKYI
jgi:hypothetical protein